ncbi:MAG TPA: hypothetical protein VFV08_11655 [Puia sp.]|nr:hypothetical protein [Puia sp.]
MVDQAYSMVMAKHNFDLKQVTNKQLLKAPDFVISNTKPVEGASVRSVVCFAVGAKSIPSIWQKNDS